MVTRIRAISLSARERMAASLFAGLREDGFALNLSLAAGVGNDVSSFLLRTM